MKRLAGVFVLLVLLLVSLPALAPARAAGILPDEAYDVVVVGAEPEGVAAAVAAARAGARVLLLERRDGPGGLYTYGWLNSFDMNYGPRGELLTRGLFAAFYREAGGTSFDVGEAGRILERWLAGEPRVNALYGVATVSPLVSATGALTAVRATVRAGAVVFPARVFVDATQDADLAASAGAPYTLGGEDYGVPEMMAATLVFKLAGVDWQAVRRALAADGDAGTDADARSAWGFWREARRYRPGSERLRLRGLNLGRQRDGSVLVNALQIFGVNGLDASSYREGYGLACREVPRIVSFLRQNIPGFGRARLAGTAPELYIRETRHIKGEYLLTLDDVLGNRCFPDQIAVASYPVDVQATNPSNYGWVFGRPKMYGIPLRCLVPLGVDNLLVVGRAASYSSLAAGSARVVPVGMATGQAAGVAAALAARKGVTPRALARDPALVREVQEVLRAQGAYLPAFSLAHPVADHWAYPAVRELQRLGLVAAGYRNDYRLEEQISAASFANLAQAAFRRTFPDAEPPSPAGNLWPEERLSLGRARVIVEGMLGHYRPGAPPFRPEHPRLRQRGDAALLTRAEAYQLVAEALAWAKRIPSPENP